MTPDEREQVLEAVADGVLDALRDKDLPHLTLALKLEIANKARRAVAAKLGAVRPTPNHLPKEFK
jgi:hypothetical protein